MALRRRRDIWDVVIVGGGLAGLTAACHASRRGMSVALFEAQQVCGGLVSTVNALDDWPSSAPESGVGLVSALVERLNVEKVEMFYERVSEVRRGDNCLILESEKQRVRARRVIAAAGAELRRIKVQGEEKLRGKGVSQCAYCDGGFFRGQKVVVVGGGDAALQQAMVLADACESVTIVVRSRLRAKRALVDRIIGKTNINFIWDSVVQSIDGEEAVCGVELRNVKDGKVTRIDCMGIFPFIGVEPNATFLPDSILRDAVGAVVTDQQFRSSEEYLFAVGALRSGYGGDLISAAGEAALAVATAHFDIRF